MIIYLDILHALSVLNIMYIHQKRLKYELTNLKCKQMISVKHIIFILIWVSMAEWLESLTENFILHIILNTLSKQ